MKWGRSQKSRLQKREAVCWPELAPPGGEATAYADGDKCHHMPPRAILHNPEVNPTSPPPGAIILLCTREPLARGRLHMHVAPESLQRAFGNTREKGWMGVWLHRSM